MGVWIEIFISPSSFRFQSVTPLVGVWIEIKNRNRLSWTNFVTPLVGVWIEITVAIGTVASLPSLPLWECGLK